MSGGQFEAETTVAEALARQPGVSQVLISNKTACVGCYFARFCTLKEAASAYSLDWDEFQRELADAEIVQIPNRGEKNEATE